MQSQPTAKQMSGLPTGVSAVHSSACATQKKQGKSDCDCTPTYRGFVYDRRTKAKIRSTTFPTIKQARDWREDSRSLQRKGLLSAPSRRTFREVADEWLAGAKASPPKYVNRARRPYKPSVTRHYEIDLRKYVLDDLGGVRMSDMRRADIQALIDRLRGRGLSEGTIRNVITATRVIFRHALERGYVEANPTAGFQLGSGNRRTRAATPAEAAELLAVLPDSIRGIYATAAYAGLRRGELRAIRWDDIDLASRVITVRTAWDDKEGPVKPKSEASTDREVPIVGVLHDFLTNLKASSGRDGRDFVFGFTADSVFEPSTVRMRAAKAWKEANVVRAEWEKPALVPIGLHELRHSYVSMMYAAGVPLETIGDYCGHSGVHMTSQYRHLLQGHREDSTKKFDDYLALADSRSRIEQLDGDAVNG